MAAHYQKQYSNDALDGIKGSIECQENIYHKPELNPLISLFWSSYLHITVDVFLLGLNHIILVCQLYLLI